MIKIQVITLFPQMFDKVLNSSMMWKAQEVGAVQFSCIDLRQFGVGPRRQVDDTPYGGGDGMLLKPDVLVAAIEHAKTISPSAKIYLPTPRGVMLKQSMVKTIVANAADMIIVCPRYEGYDERVTEWIDQQFCIGQYVLTGGELPAMVIIDAVVRLLPNVLGGELSTEIESFMQDDQNIEFPQYTRPEEFRGQKVPKVLLSGHHAQIEEWREGQSRG